MTPITQSALIGKWKYPNSKFAYEKEILIRHTNLLGNTYFANYIDWQGEAREKFFLVHPAAKEFMSQNPHILMITYCLYHRFIESTFLGDKVMIEVNSRDIQKHSAILVFRYYHFQTRKLIGDGWQKICFSDNKINQICPVPQIFLDLLEPVRLDETVCQSS